MRIKLCIIFLLTNACIQLTGQDFFFRQYGPTNGLGNSFIYSLNQGNDGYLWIGTAEGLYRFNGFEFIHFTDSSSLSENFITTIYKDYSGGLWLGHLNGGITHIKDSRFNKVAGAPADNSPITSITEADTGTIWFSTQNGGLMVYNNTKKLVRIPTSLSNELIFNIKHISANYFLVGTQENLYIMEYQKDSSLMRERIKIKNYPLSKVVDLIKFKEEEYFVLSSNKGIYKLSIDLANLSCNLVESNNNQNGDLDNIQGGLIVRRNELWINTMGKGIIKYQIDKESGKPIFLGYINTETGLKSNEVKCIFEDSEDNIWLGLYGGGLQRLVDDNIRFLSYSARIGSNHIYALSKDSSYIWIASDSLIAKVSPERGQILRSYSFQRKWTDFCRLQENSLIILLCHLPNRYPLLQQVHSLNLKKYQNDEVLEQIYYLTHFH